MLSLLFSKNKRYLTGIDWFVHALHWLTKNSTGVGNVFQVVLELNGSIQEEEFRAALTSFAQGYPLLYGSAKRDCTLAPYWKIPSADSCPPISFECLDLNRFTDRESIFSAFSEELNKPFASPREHVSFILLKSDQKAFLAARYDHRLFDACGGEAFLDLFRQWLAGQEKIPVPLAPEPVRLSHWLDKFRAGRRVNRAVLSLAKDRNPAVLPLPEHSNRRFVFKVISFNKEQTSYISERAQNEAGYLMLMPFLLASTIRAMHRVFSGRGKVNQDYVISVSIDMRPSQKVRKEPFFNHLSFLFFKVRPDEAEDLRSLLTTIKRQLYEQVKSGFAQDIFEATLPMRIAPLPLLGYLMRLPLRGELASFNFSYIGETAFSGSEFMGAEVVNLYNVPRVPVPPGLGIFFTRFREKLSAVVSFMDGLLREEELTAILRELETLAEDS